MIEIIKRDGRKVSYDSEKVINAIEKAMFDVNHIDLEISRKIESQIKKEIQQYNENISVEKINDLIEQLLMKYQLYETAKSFILYRNNRMQERNKDKDYNLLSKDFLSEYKRKPSPMGQLGNFVYYRTYSRWINEKQRREFWWETVARAVDYNCSLANTSKEEAEKLYDNIFNLKQFLSGRTFWIGGTDVSKYYKTGNFNCATVVLDDFEAYKDMFYLLMVGSGVGFRILKKDVSQLPKVRGNITVIHEHYNPVPKKARQEYTGIEFTADVATIYVSDSKEAWCQALELFLKLHYSKEYRKINGIIINYNNVRPFGERLKTFGGFASGHESMLNMLSKIEKVLHKDNSGLKKLKTVEVMDIANIIAENVVVGGVRRSAQICMIDADDDDAINAKTNLYKQSEDGSWIIDKEISHRQMSNNAIYYFEKPSRERLHWQIERMRYNGEPSFYNAQAGLKRRSDFVGTNPSMPKDVLVQTTNGIFNINELQDKDFKVKTLDGSIANAKCWFSGKDKEVFDIDFGGDRHSYATAKHKFPVITKNGIERKEVSELKIGDNIPLNRNELQGFSGNLTYEDGLLAGIIIGDGSLGTRKTLNGYDYRYGSMTVNIEDVEIKEFIDKKHLEITGVLPKWYSRVSNKEKNYLEVNFKTVFVDYLIDILGLEYSAIGKKIPTATWTQGDNFSIGLINGLFSTDGWVESSDVKTPRLRIGLTSSNYSIIKEVQKLISFYGVSSVIKKRTTTANFPNGKNYDGKIYTSYDININGAYGIRFHNIFRFLPNRKQRVLESLLHSVKKDKGYITVKEITSRGFEDVWDISVYHDQHVFPSQHCYTGNCGEILLQNKGMCNLTTVNVYGFIEDGILNEVKLLEAFRLSARAGYRMATIELELDKWDRVQAEDRLIGVSFTGWQDMVNAVKMTKEQENILWAKIRLMVNDTASLYAKSLGLNKPKLATTIKPEGTLSQLAEVSCGIHYSHSPYYIRRVRITSSDPLLRVCEELGYPIFPEVGQNPETCTTKVIEFPVKSPMGRTKYDVSAIEQLENYKRTMEFYTDHNTSITVSVRDDEWDGVEQWVWDNWDDVLGISFLSLDDSMYQLLPYEAISKEEYDERVSKMKHFNAELLKKYETQMIDSELIDDQCSSGACSVR